MLLQINLRNILALLLFRKRLRRLHPKSNGMRWQYFSHSQSLSVTLSNSPNDPFAPIDPKDPLVKFRDGSLGS